MWFAILLLLLLFIAGLISTNLNTKKFAWFQSFCAKIKTPSSHAAKSLVLSETEESEKKVGKRRSGYNNKVELRSVFATFDKNSDGYITKQELKDSLNSIGMGMTEKDIADMIKRVDSNGDGLIDLDEFCESFDSLCGGGEMNAEEEPGREDGCDAKDEEVDKDGDLKEAFAVFDGDKDGLITVEELGMVLSSLGFKEGKMLEDCKEMIRKVDMDGDGMVNFDEFKRMMKGGHKFIHVS